jgi:hypothetical protein
MNVSKMKKPSIVWGTGAVILTLAMYAAGCGDQKGNTTLKPGGRPEPATAPLAATIAADKVTEKDIHDFCAACHVFPDPSSFPRAEWKEQIRLAYKFSAMPGLKRPPESQKVPVPPMDAVVKWYQDRAPEKVAQATGDLDAPGPLPVKFQTIKVQEPGMTGKPAGVTNVNLVHLFSKDKLDILTCDGRSGNVMVLSPYEKDAKIRVIAKLKNPGHAEVADLDDDGIQDILVADLGSYVPTDAKVGRVVWLRGWPDHTFSPVTLWSGVGRIADVEMADFYGTGRHDLLVAEYGANLIGSVTLLKNETTEWSSPTFVPHEVDERTGAIHVPVTDLNHDGKPDFVALFAQEHELVFGFINQGNGEFKKELIYEAGHPAIGSSGIQLVDLNKDGKLDVLYTSGDTYDAHAILRASDGVIWLENKGTYPYTPHRITHLQCCYRAVAADVDNDGMLDIYATSLIPPWLVPKGKEGKYDSVILLKQTTPGKFTRYAVEKGIYYHVSACAGDIYGDGKQSLVTGYFAVPEKAPLGAAITIFRNLGK